MTVTTSDNLLAEFDRLCAPTMRRSTGQVLKTTGMRRSESNSLRSLLKHQSSSRVNATWDAPTRGKKRSRSMFTCGNSQGSPATKCSPVCLIGAEELKMITDMLSTTGFVGTIDPRFHSEYLASPEGSLTV